MIADYRKTIGKDLSCFGHDRTSWEDNLKPLSTKIRTRDEIFAKKRTSTSTSSLMTNQPLLA